MITPMPEFKTGNLFWVISIAGFFAFFPFLPKQASAAVGNAEEYDRFEQEDLDEFHEFLLREETHKFMTDTIGKYTKTQGEEAVKSSEESSAAISKEEEAAEQAEWELLKEQLLAFPKKKWFKFTARSSYTFDTNINRDDKLEEANTDSIFDADGIALVDFSGRKTELTLEGLYGRQWNWVFSEKDFYQMGSRLRYRRQYFKKTKHTNQIDFVRHSSKTTEINSNKVRFDIDQRTSLNYTLSRKTELNLDISSQKRSFTQEAFDQDSQWQVQAAPSFFWNVTPKSRISGGYEFGVSRIRSKSGDSNTHNYSLQYFGRITRKSSASIDLAYERQVPRSIDTARVRTVTAGVGYIYQITPKTQITTQLFRSAQNSTSDLATGEIDGENTTTKTDTHFITSSASLGINSNINKRLSANLKVGATYLSTRTFVGGDPDDETYTFSYPVSVGFKWLLKKWLSLDMSYTFDGRKGKRDESYKAQIFKVITTAFF